MAVCQTPWCSSVHIKIAGKWMFIHVHSPKSCLVDLNVYPKNKTLSVVGKFLVAPWNWECHYTSKEVTIYFSLPYLVLSLSPKYGTVP